ncbi:phage tail assembly chaperone [Lysobacter sp. HA35]
MAKLKLIPDPTFAATVSVPIPGGTADVRFTFRYRDRVAVTQWADESRDMDDASAIRSVAEGWDLDDPFDQDNVARLVQAYPGAAREVLTRYVRELAGIRQGN